MTKLFNFIAMESPDFQVTYTGELHSQLVHLKTGTTIETDAPVDNNGKGACFSPTDLVASSLASCMLTILGIHFQKKNRELTPIRCGVKKIMASEPRRIAEIHVSFDFGDNEFSKEEYKTIERLSMACPVANSLNPDLKVVTNLNRFY